MGTAAIQFGSLFWADLFVLKIKPSALQMDQCGIPRQPGERLSMVSCCGVHAQTHPRGCRPLPWYTQKQSQAQRGSVGSAGVENRQRGVVGLS